MSKAPARDARLQGLYVITDSTLTPSHRLTPCVEAALAGGARLVQYREKHRPFAERLAEARDLRALCTGARAVFLINDDVALAEAADADGVHLGQSDTSLLEARHRLGPTAIIGITCHGDPRLADIAVSNGANYVAFGRFFASSTKPDARPANIDTLAPHLAHLPVPAVAIGGITLDTAAPLISAGFSMLAVIGDVFTSQDIAGRCRAYQALFTALQGKHNSHGGSLPLNR